MAGGMDLQLSGSEVFKIRSQKFDECLIQIRCLHSMDLFKPPFCIYLSSRF